MYASMVSTCMKTLSSTILITPSLCLCLQGNHDVATFLRSKFLHAIMI